MAESEDHVCLLPFVSKGMDQPQRTSHLLCSRGLQALSLHGLRRRSQQSTKTMLLSHLTGPEASSEELRVRCPG